MATRAFFRKSENFHEFFTGPDEVLAQSGGPGAKPPEIAGGLEGGSPPANFSKIWRPPPQEYYINKGGERGSTRSNGS